MAESSSYWEYCGWNSVHWLLYDIDLHLMLMNGANKVSGDVMVDVHYDACYCEGHYTCMWVYLLFKPVPSLFLRVGVLSLSLFCHMLIFSSAVKSIYVDFLTLIECPSAVDLFRLYMLYHSFAKFQSSCVWHHCLQFTRLVFTVQHLCLHEQMQLIQTSRIGWHGSD